MASTTITLNEEAYAVLRSLKGKGDSFSQVVLRHVRPPADTCGELLERLESEPPPQILRGTWERGRRSRRPK